MSCAKRFPRGTAVDAPAGRGIAKELRLFHATMASLTQSDAAPKVAYKHLEPKKEMQCSLLWARIGADMWLNHATHTPPPGTIKFVGGPSYLERFTKGYAKAPAIFYLTPDNQGRSLAFASARQNVSSTIAVLHFSKPGTSVQDY